MKTASERTMDMLKGLDDLLSDFDDKTGDKNNQKKIESNLRWINQHLDKNTIKEVLKSAHELENSEVIIELLDQKEFDPKQYN